MPRCIAFANAPSNLRVNAICLGQNTRCSGKLPDPVGWDQAHLQLRANLRIDTPIEIDYYRQGGILPFVLRQLLSK